jgi:hypothetical protein
MKTPSCSSTPVLNHLDLLLPSPGTAYSIYPNVTNHNICTYQNTNEMSKTQMIGVQIKLGAEVAWSKGTRLIKRIFPHASLELSGWIDSLPWKDMIEKDDITSWESRKTTVGLEKDEDYYYVEHYHLSDNGSVDRNIKEWGLCLLNVALGPLYIHGKGAGNRKGKGGGRVAMETRGRWPSQ